MEKIDKQIINNKNYYKQKLKNKLKNSNSKS